MAKLKRVESSPISGNDDLGGTFSVLEFISSMPTILSWSDNASIHHLKLFWTQDDYVMEKIKSAIKDLGIFIYPTLFQIWVPKDVSGQQVLVSADQLFGISSLRKGLCMFRKKCLEKKYILDGEECVSGPVGRVFRNGFPEFSPNVSCYSSEEFELRDHAESCGVHGYLVLPVFEGEEKKCGCVIELVTVFDGNYCLTRTVEGVSEALKTIGMRTCNTSWPIGMERSSQHDSALSEIERDLKVVCQEHNIPFAQTWFASKEEGSTETVMCTSGNGSSMLKKSFSSFQNDCIMFGLKKGQSVVWRAFESSNSWFCEDVSQLSIKDYSLVLSARKVNLSAAFAIHLKSPCTEDGDSYVLEFFLPLNNSAYGKQSACFMNLVLTTVSQHFKSFKIAIRQEQGIGGTIYSVNSITDCEEKEKSTEHASDMVLDIPPASPVPVVQAMQRPSDENPIIVKAIYKDDIIKFQLPLHSGMVNLKDEIIHRLKFDEDGFKIKYQVENDEWIQVDSDADLHKCIDVAKSLPNRTLRLVLETLTMITTEVTYKEDIITFQLPLHSRLVELKGEIILPLKLDEESFKIKYRAENNEWIQVDSDADLHKCMDDVKSLENRTLRLVLEAITKITITVTYENDIIKFQLYPSAGMVDLKNEVTKRFKISCFRVKYGAGDADGSWHYISDDENLQKYLRDMISNKSTIKFHIERIEN